MNSIHVQCQVSELQPQCPNITGMWDLLPSFKTPIYAITSSWLNIKKIIFGLDLIQDVSINRSSNLDKNIEHTRKEAVNLDIFKGKNRSK